MIGHWLLALLPEHEDALLTKQLAPGFTGHCLLSVTVTTSIHADCRHGPDGTARVVYRQYDDACRRFGNARVNIAIRNRILANQARRVLAAVRAPQQAPA